MYYILKNKIPVPCRNLKEWGEYMFKRDRVIEKTTYKDINVSTVFLGLDHNTTIADTFNLKEYKPILFETMVFGGELDEKQIRYATYGQAKIGHFEVLEEVINMYNPSICRKTKNFIIEILKGVK